MGRGFSHKYIFYEPRKFPQNLRRGIGAKKESDFCPRHPNIARENKWTQRRELI